MDLMEESKQVELLWNSNNKSFIMKRLLLFLLFVGLFSSNSIGQVFDPVLGPRAWKKENTEQRDAITLTHIREADVMWSTRIWRELDLRQKINHPLYFPLDSAIHGKRSFIRILFDNYLNNKANFGPNGVKLYMNSEFEVVYTFDEIQRIVQRTDSVQKVDGFCNVTDTVVTKYFSDLMPRIVKVKLMEDWFFDKQRSIMDVRILGLGIEIQDMSVRNSVDPNCGVAVFEDFEYIPNSFSEIWFYFPDIRPDLAVLECYKRQNDAARLSYDDIFMQRIFASYIYREENVFNRKISLYTSGLDALLEAENIKTKIFEFEQNVWQY
jgi:gliding motility associated protien GldN